MDDSVLPPKLLKQLSMAAETVRGHDFIHLFSHYDADGISAAAVTAKALLRAGKGFKATLLTTLDDAGMDLIRASGADCVIVTDLGASYIRELDAMDCDVVVLDHHTVQDAAERICYINPHLHGMDGMTAGCGATLALLFAVTLDRRNWDLVQTAFAGIVGDRQHLDGLTGLNAYLLEEGVDRGHLRAGEGALIPPGTVGDVLLTSSDPYIRGVSGEPGGVQALLEEAAVDPEADWSDLPDEARRRLSSLIVLRLIDQGVPLRTMDSLMRTRYALTGRGMDAERLSSLIDSCGRMGLTGLGLGAGLGDPDCLEEAERIARESDLLMLGGVRAVAERGLEQMENIQWFDSSSSGFTGMICGVVMQYLGDPGKPTIGINRSEEQAKVSSRSTREQLDRGVDLAAALSESCAAVGGSGGGHRIASGGAFAAGETERFLGELDRIIGAQLSARRP
jgi:single-stranded-DNA-specific exonuclease